MAPGKETRKKSSSRRSPARKAASQRHGAKKKKLLSRQRFVRFAVAASAAALLLASVLVILHYRSKNQGAEVQSTQQAQLAEIELKPQNLSERIALLDQVLYGDLFKAGLSRDHIVSRRTAPRSPSSETWELKTIEIKLPGAVTLEAIKDYFRKNGSPIPAGVTREFTHDEGDLLAMDIALDGFPTHRILFSRPQQYASLPPQQKLKPAPVPIAGRVAIIIDDIGLAREPAQEIMGLKAPIVLSIFPFASFSREIAEIAHAKGHEVVLHLPLEPHDYPGQDPGPGALFTSMDSRALVAQLTKNLNSVPHAKGINNHMGSRFTENEAAMTMLLEWMKGKGLFFVDSRTTPMTVAHSLAARMGIPSAERRVFLDNDQHMDAVLAKIDELGEIAMKEGKAIGIGHPYPTTIAALRKGIPHLKSRGFKIVPVSEILE